MCMLDITKIEKLEVFIQRKNAFFHVGELVYLTIIGFINTFRFPWRFCCLDFHVPIFGIFYKVRSDFGGSWIGTVDVVSLGEQKFQPLNLFIQQESSNGTATEYEFDPFQVSH